MQMTNALSPSNFRVAVVDFYGPADFTVEEARDTKQIRRFMTGKKFAETRQQYELASPVAG